MKKQKVVRSLTFLERLSPARGTVSQRATGLPADQARVAIFDYIEAFYNRQRRHSALEILSPANFETKND